MAEQLSAGEAMDIRILEKVMGYSHLVGREVPAINRHDGEPIEAQEVWLRPGDRICRLCGEIPGFSTDWSTFELLVKYLQAGNWQVTMMLAGTDSPIQYTADRVPYLYVSGAICQLSRPWSTDRRARAHRRGVWRMISWDHWFPCNVFWSWGKTIMEAGCRAALEAYE